MEGREDFENSEVDTEARTFGWIWFSWRKNGNRGEMMATSDDKTTFSGDTGIIFSFFFLLIFLSLKQSKEEEEAGMVAVVTTVGIFEGKFAVVKYVVVVGGGVGVAMVVMVVVVGVINFFDE